MGKFASWKLKNGPYLPNHCVNSNSNPFILLESFESALVLFESAFSLWVSLKLILLQPLEMISIQMCHVLWEQFCYCCMYTKTVGKKSQLFKETTLVVKLLRCWSTFKCNDIQTWFSVIFQYIHPCFNTFPGFPTGVENIGDGRGLFKIWWEGLSQYMEGAWGLKMLLKNTYEGVHLIVKLLAISL